MTNSSPNFLFTFIWMVLFFTLTPKIILGGGFDAVPESAELESIAGDNRHLKIKVKVVNRGRVPSFFVAFRVRGFDQKNQEIWLSGERVKSPRPFSGARGRADYSLYISKNFPQGIYYDSPAEFTVTIPEPFFGAFDKITRVKLSPIRQWELP